MMVLPITSSEAHHVAGVWHRLFEEDPLDSGAFDRETLVHWVQAPCGIYVDIRLPPNDPGRSLADAAAAGFVPNPSTLLANGSIGDDTKNKISDDLRNIFLNQMSFAGYLMLGFGDTTDGEALEEDETLAALAASDDGAIPLCTCFWRRDIDYQPPTGGLDVGVCVSGPVKDDGTIDMRETGNDASYAEGWRRLTGTRGDDLPFCALELVEENGCARKGFWVRAGNRFAYAVGRPSNEEASEKLGCVANSHKVFDHLGETLAEAVAGQDTALEQAWSYVGAMGEVKDDGTWFIESSTRPNLVGCSLLGGDASTCCSTLAKDSSDYNHVNQAISGTDCVRKWRVAEVSGFDLPIY